MQLVREFIAAVWSQILACGIIQHSLYEFLFMLHLLGPLHLFPTLMSGQSPLLASVRIPTFLGQWQTSIQGVCAPRCSSCRALCAGLLGLSTARV